uniref:ribosomal protein L21 n=1 Tax=Merotricha bacillata TaxID=658122 RepID=UPI002113CCBA|nr:ribosomal protein L21 [Merotricha bacillata]UTE94555.1 ribosomal protein L21 [Merotricha bacillata]
MNYAIIEISGRQFWIEPQKFYVINHLSLQPNTQVLLKRVLLLNENGEIEIGYPYLNSVTIDAMILNNFKGKKIIVYKMKPKKKYRRKNGYRSFLTTLYINSIN